MAISLEGCRAGLTLEVDLQFWTPFPSQHGAVTEDWCTWLTVVRKAPVTEKLAMAQLYLGMPW